MHFLSIKSDGTIVSRNGVEGYFKETVLRGIEGNRIDAQFAGTEMFVECKSEKAGSRDERLIFTVQVGQSRAGFFSWPKENMEMISGRTFAGKSEYLWFWGLSLMYLWRKERDRELTGGF